jgi:glutaryl-CoA dehydrogenase
MIADAAAAFAADKLMPRVTDAYLNEVTDREIFSEMGEAGLLGVTIPEIWRRRRRLRLLRPRRARGRTVDSGYRSMMSVQSSLVMYPIRLSAAKSSG